MEVKLHGILLLNKCRELVKGLHAGAGGRGLGDGGFYLRGDLLDGRGIEMPPIKQVSKTFKRTPKSRRKGPETESLLD